LISDSVRKMKKYARFVNLVKKLVCSYMEFSINLLACRQPSNVPMTTTTSFKDIVWRQNVNMKYSKDNSKERKKRLTSNLREFLKLKKSLINLIVL
jgi:hypothetical protein